jgi:predicted phosphodiesterase
MKLKLPLFLFALLNCNAALSFSFIVFGDLNGGGCARNDRVERIVQKMSNEGNVDFFISTGDLIDGFPENDGSISSCFATDPNTINGSSCANGTNNGNMRQILSPILDRAPIAGLQFSFYPVIGNHDDNWGSGWYPSPCNDGICALLHQAGETDDAMIARYIDDHAPGDICSLDPQVSNHSNSFYYAFAYQNSYFIVLRQNNDFFGMLSCNNLPASHTSCETYCSDPSLFNDPARNNRCYAIEQFDWLRAKLDFANQNNFQHIFLFAHAPLLTSGENHGATVGSQQFRQLLESNNVDIYFNGHNHAYERSKKILANNEDSNGTAYITVGVAGAQTDTITGDWFTAADYRNWTNNFADLEKMATYTIISVDGSDITGTVKSLDPNNLLNSEIVDTFNYGSGQTVEDLIYQNSFESSSAPIIAGCQILPEDNIWNTAIDTFALNPNSSTYINTVGANTPLHADFGTQWQGTDIGIPYTLIAANQATTPVELLYWDESDLNQQGGCNTGGQNNIGCYPIPANPNIEGGSDRHILMLQQNTCQLYELFNAQFNGNIWAAGSGAIWDLNQNQQRPLDWTSADASGLAILPGLVRYDEVYVEGEIKHAIRFTLNNIQAAYIQPATHSDGQGGHDPSKPPMGLRLRLKSGFDITAFDPAIQIVLTAMKKYGIILADTGADMFISGEHHDLWNDEILSQLATVKLADFEVVNSGNVTPYPHDWTP